MTAYICKAKPYHHSPRPEWSFRVDADNELLARAEMLRSVVKSEFGDVDLSVLVEGLTKLDEDPAAEFFNFVVVEFDEDLLFTVWCKKTGDGLNFGFGIGENIYDTDKYENYWIEYEEGAEFEVEPYPYSCVFKKMASEGKFHLKYHRGFAVLWFGDDPEPSDAQIDARIG
jgi:hypothetical protein